MGYSSFEDITRIGETQLSKTEIRFGKAEKRIIQNALDRIKTNPRLPIPNGNSAERKKTLSEVALRIFLKRGEKGVKFTRLRKSIEKHSRAADIDLATRKVLQIVKRKVSAEGGNLLVVVTRRGSRKYWIVASSE